MGKIQATTIHGTYIIYEDLTFTEFNEEVDLNSFINLINIRKDKKIKSVLICSNSIGDYRIPSYIKNIYFLYRKKELGMYPAWIPKVNTEQNFYLFVERSHQVILDEIHKCIQPNIKLIPSIIGFYGMCSDALHTVKYPELRAKNITNHLKFKELKKCEDILWYGQEVEIANRNHIPRKLVIQNLQNNYIAKIIHTDSYIDLKKKSLIDILIENNCFCVLSLDGCTAQCYRDTELGLSKIFNLKHTSLQADISAANSIYLSRNINEFKQNILEIKKDISLENYSKLFTAEKYMRNLFLFRKFHFSSQALLTVESLSYIMNLNINKLILHDSINEKISEDEIFNLYNSFLNRCL